jgi:SAM-dependent methyltransferase
MLRALPRDGASLLDVGCGDGAVLAELAAQRPRWTLAAVEIAEAAARIARERLPAIDVRVYDGARLPWPESSFDVGLLSHVLEHVDDPQAVLGEVSRVCRLVVVEVPLERNLSARRASRREQASEIGHLQRLSRHDVRQIVRGAGLELREELTATLTRDALRFFADNRADRARADVKWAVQRALHRCAPPLAERIFTVQYVALCAPSPR